MRSLVIVILLSVTGPAMAQVPAEAVVGAEAPAAATPAEVPSPDTETPPAPNDVAAAVPMGRAYQLSWEVDLPMLLVPGIIMLGWPLSDTFAPPHCAPVCSPEGLNALDAPSAGLYSEAWTMASDIGVAVMLAGAVMIPFVDEEPLDALNDLVVIAQAVAWTEALAILTSMASRRPRPMMYSESAPLEMRNDPDSALSFFSGHTGTAFAVSTALFQTLRRRHPDSALPWITLAVGDAIGIFISVGRVKAGRHFPTDVLAAAVVGTSVGLLVPALHDAPVQIAPMAIPGGGGVAVGGVF